MRALRNGLLLAVIACAAVVGVAAPAGAGAPPSPLAFEPVGRWVAGPPLGDGGRWIVYAQTPTTLRVLDDERGESYDAPIPCVSPTRGATLTAVGGGQALVGCASQRSPTSGDRPLLLDLATRTWHEAAGVEALFASYDHSGSGSDSSIRFTAVGSRWLEGSVGGYHWDRVLWLDWQTGTVKTNPPQSATTVTSLDAPALTTRLCAPLRRTPYDGEDDLVVDEPAFDPITYAPPYAIVGGAGGSTALALARCGTSRLVALERPSDVVGLGLQLGGDAVSWPGGSRVAPADRLYLPWCGVRLSWPGHAKAWLHTPRSLYRAQRNAGGRWWIERTPLPSCATATAAVQARVSSGGRTVRPQVVAGRWDVVPERFPSERGVTATALAGPAGGLDLLRIGADGRMRVAIAAAVRSMRWLFPGIDAGAARRTRGGWTLTLPRSLRRTRLLVLDVVLRDGRRVEEWLRVTPRARR